LIDVLTKSADPRERARAAQALGELGPKAKDAVPALVSALDDDAPSVRVDATVALGRIGPDARAAVPHLVATMKWNRMAKEALIGIGDASAPAATKLLADADASVQAVGAEILAWVGPTKDAGPTLEALLKDSKSPDVRIWAAAGLVRVGTHTKESLEFLKRSLSERGQVGRLAAAALGAAGPPGLAILIEALTGDNRTVAFAAGMALPRLGAAVVEPLAKLLQSDDFKVRLAAVGVLDDLDPGVLAKCVPTLVAELRKGDEKTWRDVGRVLANVGANAVPPLLDVVRAQKGRARLAAANTPIWIQGRDRDPRLADTIGQAVVPVVAEELENKDAKIRWDTTQLLGWFGRRAAPAVPALLKAAQTDPSPGVRGGALEAMAATGVTSDELLKAVLAGLADKEREVRYGAAYACANLGPAAKDAVPVLTGLVGKDVTIKAEPAIMALGRIGPVARSAAPRLLEVLKDEDPERVATAAIALLQIGSEEKAAVAAPTKALQEREPADRFRAMVALHGIGPAGKPLVPLLKTLASASNSDPVLRAEAQQVLGEIDPNAAGPAKKD
jgi:HEAT repeat protein